MYELLEWWSDLFVLPCLAEAAITEGTARRWRARGPTSWRRRIWTDAAGPAAAVRRLRDALASA